MNCDSIIDEKLTKYPMTDDVFARTSFNIVLGRMGAGKTSWVTSLVKKVFKKCFHSIYVFIPENSRVSIDNDIYGKCLPENQLFSELTLENISQVYEELKENSKEGYFSLLIIDDFQTLLKDKQILSVLKKIVTKMRHLRTTIFLLQQNWFALDKSLRELCSNIIFFDLGKSQLYKLFDEVIQLQKEKYDEIIDVSFKQPHDWILVNLNKSKKIYNNFNEIILE